MPFITERIWQLLGPDGLLISSPWPEAEPGFFFPEVRRIAELKHGLVSAARMLRKEYELPPAKKISFVIVPGETANADDLAGEAETMAALIRNWSLAVEAVARPEKTVPSALVSDWTVYMPLRGVIDPEAEQQRFGKKLAQAEEALKRVRARLRNPDFLSKAPPEVKEKTRTQLEDLTREVLNLKKILSTLE
jgi:valyl-tRNA synthetase